MFGSPPRLARAVGPQRKRHAMCPGNRTHDNLIMSSTRQPLVQDKRFDSSAKSLRTRPRTTFDPEAGGPRGLSLGFRDVTLQSHFPRNRPLPPRGFRLCPHVDELVLELTLTLRQFSVSRIT
ncbi:uncharacterized protein LOC143018207 [Oratosquilla oratoria]|uniref:uncharacterized protein LOC143018207 n=1 Tax=Oratosquilla oratoria TaxID=337810 RepID=UPI003F775BF3